MLRHAVKAAALRRSAAAAQRHALQSQPQSRSMGFFSDLKNQLKSEMEKNPELKKSFEELEKTKEQFKQAEKAAVEKMQEVSSRTEEAAKEFQEQASSASQKLRETIEENVSNKAAAGSEQESEAKKQAAEGAAEGEKKAEGEEKTEAASVAGVEGARAFASKFFSDFSQTKDRVLNATNLSAKAQDEWKAAAAELFGAKQQGSVDEALSSVKTPTMTMTQKPVDGEEVEEYTGPSALVAVKEDESAWQKVSARFREAPIINSILDAAKKAARTEAGKKVGEKAKLAKDKIGDATEEVLEMWETSQNPWVYRLSSIYDGFFGETPMAVAIKEIRRAEPDFILEEWKQKIEDIVLPGVLEALLRGNSRDLKKWLGEAAYSRFNIAIRERKTDGLVMDHNVLGIDHVEVFEATAEDKQAPIILLRFQAQQINCIRNREGEVVDGAEDEVLAYYYVFAFQRDYDEEQEALRWRIVDILMQRGGRFY